ncbi:MAG: hypothetical protein AB1634_04600 [Thermodesulfobacteriota bacterium]
MRDLTYTLVTDGSSDRVLRYPIEWLLLDLVGLAPIGSWAEPPARRPDWLAELIKDYSALRQLPAFQAFETDLRQVLAANGWLGAQVQGVAMQSCEREA